MMNKEWKDATQQGDLEKVKSLLNQGADANSRDEHGQTALMNAAHEGEVELLRLLIEHGADLNVTAKYNLSALMLALIAGHTEAARLLIEAGADLGIWKQLGLRGTNCTLTGRSWRSSRARLLTLQGLLSAAIMFE